MQEMNKHVQEEREKYKKIVLKFLKEGLSKNEISSKINKSTTYVTKLINILISENKITDEEIHQAKQIARDNKRIERKKAEENKRYEYKLKNRLKERILRYIKKGETPDELVAKLKTSQYIVEECIKELIIERKINYDDLAIQKNEIYRIAELRNNTILSDIASGEYTIETISKKYGIATTVIEHISKRILISEHDTEKTVKISDDVPQKIDLNISEDIKLNKIEKSILKYLTKGYQYSFISRRLEISDMELLSLTEVLVHNGVITEEQVNYAQTQKRIDDDNEIIYYLKLGYRQADILKKKKEYNLTELFKIIEDLKSEGRINDDEINTARDNIREKLNSMVRELQEERKRNSYRRNETMNEENAVQIENDENESKTINQHIRKINEVQEKNFENESDIIIFNYIKMGLYPRETANCLKEEEEQIVNRYKAIMEQFNITGKDISMLRKERKQLYSIAREEARKEAKNENLLRGRGEKKKSIPLDARKRFIQLAINEIKYRKYLS